MRLLRAEQEISEGRIAIETERKPTGMRVADPEMMEKGEGGRIILEGGAIPEKGEELTEGEIPDTMVAVLEKTLEGVEEGEESRASTWCFRYSP